MGLFLSLGVMPTACGHMSRRWQPTLLPPVAALAAALHIGSVVMAGCLRPNYSSFQSAISDLGRAHEPYRELVNLGGMAIPGSLLVVSALLMAGFSPLSVLGRLGVAFLGLAGGLLLLSGLVPFPSPIHLGASVAAAITGAVGIAAFSAWVTGFMRRKGWVWIGLVCAMLLTANASLWVLQRSDPRPRPFLYLGLQQRIASFSALTWFAVCVCVLNRRIGREGQQAA